MAAACWYVAQTKPQAEPLAVYHLKRQNYATLWLHYATQVRHARRVTVALRGYFPRYLFVQVDETQAIGPISRSPGVTALIQSGQEPIQVPTSIIAELQSRASPDGLVTPLPARLRPPLAPGEDVMITHGPLSGFRATVILDDKTKVRLLVKWLGRQIEATVEPGAITAASPALRSVP
jgi:transcriptional antiterminator RfaH